MEEGRRKQVMIGVIVFCFAVAAYITFSGGGTDNRGEQIGEDDTVWIKCLNPKCKHTYEMSLLDYREFQRQHVAEDVEPAMVCEKCSKPSAFKAEKCLKCGAIFFFGDAGEGKPSDECPKCGAVQSELLKEQE